MNRSISELRRRAALSFFVGGLTDRPDAWPFPARFVPEAEAKQRQEEQRQRERDELGEAPL
jgi:hypothetical protein